MKMEEAACKNSSSTLCHRMTHPFCKTFLFNQCQENNVLFCVAFTSRNAGNMSKVTAKASSLLSLIGWAG
jgi:hypothetical protein